MDKYGSEYNSKGRAEYLTVDEVRKMHEVDFLKFFGAPLAQFWDNTQGGFQIGAFCTQMLWGYMDTNPGKETQRLYGWRAQRAVRRIIEDLAKVW